MSLDGYHLISTPAGSSRDDHPILNAMSHKSVDIIRNSWIQGIQSRISFKLVNLDLHRESPYSLPKHANFKTYASPPNLRVCCRSDSSADMYQTCPELSMNTQAPAARYIVIYLSTNERGQRSNVQILSVVTGYYSFQRMSYIPTCSCLLSDVSRISHSEDNIDFTTIYRDIRYRCFSARQFIFLSRCSLFDIVCCVILVLSRTND
ncbi:hypothetical protein BDR06DRAFT_956990 [Suillus hirtellus]|nr:hypothetical protein BDR06DRAFT_956990 [Suillus hirtellus]